MVTPDAAPPDPLAIEAAPTAQVRSSRHAPGTVVLMLLALMLLAVVIRTPGLRGPDGQLNTDEARLTLAGGGVLQHGYPVMPSGRIYTRGLLNAYLIGGSFALFGRHDFAARLPSVLAGTLLVPVVYLLGQAFSSGGRGRVTTLSLTGLTAAVFAALAEPLAYYSASAWLPSIFLLLFVWAIYCCYRGFVSGQARWQVAGALSFWLALLSYEFSVLLLAGLGLFLLCQVVRRRWGWYRGRTTLVAFGLFLAGLALFAGLALVLRSGTLAGAYGEIRNFVSPGARLQGLSFYLRYLLADYLGLLAALILALPLLVTSRPRGTLFLGLLMALSFLVPSLLITVQRSPRYALPVLPLLAVLAAESVSRLARWSGPRLGVPRPFQLALPVVAVVLVFGLVLAGDVRTAIRELGAPPPGPTWVQALDQQGLQPDDLILAESANKVHYYLGRADFYVRPDDYERYAYQADDTLRYLYTGAALLLGRGDFERLVEGPNPGRTLWVVGRADRLPDRAATLDPALWLSLLASAEQRVETADGWLLLKLRLPRTVRPA